MGEELAGPEEDLWELEKAATFLNIKPRTLEGWVARKVIPFVKMRTGGNKGGGIRFRPESLRHWVATREFIPEETE